MRSTIDEYSQGAGLLHAAASLSSRSENGHMSTTWDEVPESSAAGSCRPVDSGSERGVQGGK